MEVSQRRRFRDRTLSMLTAVATICTLICGTAIPVSASDSGFLNPITGTVQGAGYSESAGHYGIDLYPHNYGDPVYAVASGTITYSCKNNHTRVIQAGDDCGSVKILLDEPFSYNGYTYESAFYTHMSGLVYDIYCGFNSGCIADHNAGRRNGALKSGTVHVEAGQIIGYVGKGNAATHLHFSFETGEDSNYHMMPNSEYYKVFGWSYNGSITACAAARVPDTANTPSAASGLTLEQLQAKFPAGAYWNGGNPDSYTWSPCVCHGRHTCGSASDCTCNSYTYNGVKLAQQCMGFAYKLQQDVYGGNPYGWPEERDYAKAMANLKPGDVVRYNGHSIFITYVNGDYIEYADCNSSAGGRCQIRWGANNQTKTSLKSGFSYVTPAPDSPGSIPPAHPDECTCSTGYAGTYTCITSSSPLTIRSGHGTGYSAIGSIPSGATVTVTKANGNFKGSWGHVEYGGISGYASMEYLAKAESSSLIYPVPFKSYPLSDAEHAADAYDAVNGNHIGFIYGTDYCTVKEIYTNGWCLVNCPWGSSTKDVFTWTGNFISTSCSPYTKVIETAATTYIRLGSSSELGWIDPGDQVTVVDDTYSSRKQIIYPHTDGTFRCAWVDANVLVHTHTPGAAATCTSPQVCTTCDAILMKETGHSPGAAATCTNDQICTACGVILDAAKGHTLGAAATCTTPQICTVCGATLVYATGHRYTAGDYTDPAHPHIIYNRCACGARIDSGSRATIADCAECHPVPTAVRITYPPSAVKVGDTVTFTLHADGADAYQLCIGDGVNVVLQTDRTPDNTATYTFRAKGTYYIWGYAYNGELTATAPAISVTVDSAEVPVSGVTLNTVNASASVGESFTLTATVLPPEATNRSVIWTSSDPTVAAVENGVVTARRAGTAIITAASSDGDYRAACTVTVRESAVNQPTISLGAARGRIGGQVIIPVSISNNPGIVSMTLKVTYDASVFRLIGVNDTSLLSGSMHSNIYSSPYTLTWENDTSRSNFYVTGTLVELVFAISDTAATGEYSFTVTYPKDGIYNFDAENITFQMDGGICTVSDYLPGDVNGDGEVTNKDRLLLSRHLANWEGYGIDQLVFEAADINGDGEITNRDRLLLSRHLANWSGYENLSDYRTEDRK